MKTKLTLSIEKGVLERAKRLTKKSRTSLSRIFEDYLREITNPQKNKKRSSVTDSLSGILSSHYGDKNYEEMKVDLHKEKYGI